MVCATVQFSGVTHVVCMELTKGPQSSMVHLIQLSVVYHVAVFLDPTVYLSS